MLCPAISRKRADNDVEVAVPEHLGRSIRVPVWGRRFDETVDDVEPEFLVRFLASSEAKLDAHFHVVAQEIDGTSEFSLEVVGVNKGRELELFHFAGGLAAMDLLAALGLLVLELSVVHDAANRRSGAGHRLNQVEASLLRQAQGVRQGHDPELLLVFVEDADFPGADLAVSAVFGFPRVKGTRRKSTQGILAG